MPIIIEHQIAGESECDSGTILKDFKTVSDKTEALQKEVTTVKGGLDKYALTDNFVSLTQAEYDALGAKPNTDNKIYFIIEG